MRRLFKFSQAGEELFNKWDTRLGNEEERTYYLLAGLKDTGWLPTRALNFLLRKGLLEEDKSAALIEQALGQPTPTKEKYIPPECEITVKSIQLMEKSKKDYNSLTQEEAMINAILWAYCDPDTYDAIPPWTIFKLIELVYLKPVEEKEDESSREL